MQEPVCNAYLDNAATTPVIDEAIEVMNDVLRHAWGNPSSSHRVGYAAPFAADPRKLYKVGVNFNREKRCIDEWKVIP